jgi:hypothetical protein
VAVKYVANVGINYPGRRGEERLEAGEEVPAGVVERAPWLLEQQIVSVVDAEEEVTADGPDAR